MSVVRVCESDDGATLEFCLRVPKAVTAQSRLLTDALACGGAATVQHAPEDMLLWLAATLRVPEQPCPLDFRDSQFAHILQARPIPQPALFRKHQVVFQNFSAWLSRRCCAWPFTMRTRVVRCLHVHLTVRHRLPASLQFVQACTPESTI